MLESLRWRPVSFGGFAHCKTKDITWNNSLIPAEPSQMILRSSQNCTSSILSVRLNVQVICTIIFGLFLLALAVTCPAQHVTNRSILINTVLILWTFAPF
ncbi:hypothetical protein BD769DRAFT_1463246 [Suillus cothurnatus]|nr:hypothetical protein BD769DRAFT_1463246 [Suillus cothurnatus]